jgi:hypothetical protein
MGGRLLGAILLASCVASCAQGCEPRYRAYLEEIVRLARPQKWPWPALSDGAELAYSALPTASPQRLGASKFHVAVIGDSFAHPMAAVFNEIAKKRRLSVLLSSTATCAPFFDKVSLDTTTPFDNGVKNNIVCKQEVRPAVLGLLLNSGARVAVLNGNWVGTHQLWRATKDPVGGTSLQDTIHLLRSHGVKVVVVGMVPGSHYDVPVCHDTVPACSGRTPPASAACRGSTPIADLTSAPHTRESGKRQQDRNTMRATLTRIMEELVRLHPTQIAYVDPYEVMCDGDECLTFSNGQSLYYDDHHLSANGTLLFQAAFEKVLAKLEVKLQ